jgi:hypothetical protein
MPGAGSASAVAALGAARLVVSDSALKPVPGTLRLDGLRGCVAFAAHAPGGEAIALDGRAVRLCDLLGAQARTLAEDVSGGGGGARALCWDPSSGLVAVALPTRVELFLLRRGDAVPGGYSPAQWAAYAATAQLRRLGTVALGLTGLVGLEWGGARTGPAPPLLLIATQGGAGALLADCTGLLRGADVDTDVSVGAGSPHEPPSAHLHALPGAESAGGSALTCATWAGHGSFVAAGDTLGCVRVWDLRELVAGADAGAQLVSSVRLPTLLGAPTGAANAPVSNLVSTGRGDMDLLCTHGEVPSLAVGRSVALAARLSGGLHSFGIEEALFNVGRGRDAPALRERITREPLRELRGTPADVPAEPRGVLDSLMSISLPPGDGEDDWQVAAKAASLDLSARRPGQVDGRWANWPGDEAGADAVALRAVGLATRNRTLFWSDLLGDPQACLSVRQARLVASSDCGGVMALAGPMPAAAIGPASDPAPAAAGDHVTLLRVGTDTSVRTVADVAVSGRVRGLRFTPDGAFILVMLSGPAKAAAPLPVPRADAAQAQPAKAATGFFFGGSDKDYELWLTSIAVPAAVPAKSPQVKSVPVKLPPGDLPDDLDAKVGDDDDLRDDDAEDENQESNDEDEEGTAPAEAAQGAFRGGTGPPGGGQDEAKRGGKPRRRRGGRREREKNEKRLKLAKRLDTGATNPGGGVDAAASNLLRVTVSADSVDKAMSGTVADATAAAAALAPSPRDGNQPPQVVEDLLRAVLALSLEMSARLGRIERAVTEQGERIARIEAAALKPSLCDCCRAVECVCVVEDHLM